MEPAPKPEPSSKDDGLLIDFWAEPATPTFFEPAPAATEMGWGHVPMGGEHVGDTHVGVARDPPRPSTAPDPLLTRHGRHGPMVRTPRLALETSAHI